MLERKPTSEVACSRLSPQEFAEHHLDLVIQVARAYRRTLPSGVDFDDLVGAGNQGLVLAARRFNLARGVSFPSYARHRIRGAIGDYLRSLDPLSRDLRSQRRAAEQVIARLADHLGRLPTDTEIARHLRISKCRWWKLKQNLYEAGHPLHGQVRNTPVVSPEDVPASCEDPEQFTGKNELSALLNRALQTLSPRYRQVVYLYYFKDWTMKQIGCALRVNESRISQIHSLAMKQLRVRLEAVGVESSSL